jgi:hypothetical protein
MVTHLRLSGIAGILTQLNLGEFEAAGGKYFYPDVSMI